jgi:hypothetical protein
MKTTITKKLFTFILLASGMFSFTVADAQCFCYCTSHPRPRAECYTRSNGTEGCRGVGHVGCGERIANAASTPDVSSLEDIYPNPVSTYTTVSFSVRQSENVSLKIFDVSGRLVTTLADRIFGEGENEITWNAADVNAGIYSLRMETASYSENRKLIVTK